MGNLVIFPSRNHHFPSWCKGSPPCGKAAPRRWRPLQFKHLKFLKPARGIYSDAGVRRRRLVRDDERVFVTGHSTVVQDLEYIETQWVESQRGMRATKQWKWWRTAINFNNRTHITAMKLAPDRERQVHTHTSHLTRPTLFLPFPAWTFWTISKFCGSTTVRAVSWKDGTSQCFKLIFCFFVPAQQAPRLPKWGRQKNTFRPVALDWSYCAAHFMFSWKGQYRATDRLVKQVSKLIICKYWWHWHVSRRYSPFTKRGDQKLIAGNPPCGEGSGTRPGYLANRVDKKNWWATPGKKLQAKAHTWRHGRSVRGGVVGVVTYLPKDLPPP